MKKKEKSKYKQRSSMGLKIQNILISKYSEFKKLIESMSGMPFQELKEEKVPKINMFNSMKTSLVVHQDDRHMFKKQTLGPSLDNPNKNSTKGKEHSFSNINSTYEVGLGA